MIVLEIAARGHCSDVRWAGAEAVLGSAPSASIRVDDAGWGPREAVLLHLGDRVLVVRSDGSGETRLSMGESTRVGEATVTLVGIGPLAPAAAEEDEENAPAPAYPDTGWRPQLDDDVPAARPAPAPAAPVAHAFGAKSAPLPPPAPPCPPLPAAAAASVARPAASPPPPLEHATAPTPPPPPAAAPKEAHPSAWRVHTFEDELVGAIRSSPWFALSAAIHALVVAVMLAVVTEPVATRPIERYGIATEALAQNEWESGGPADKADPMLDPAIDAAPEVEDVPVLPDAAPEIPLPDAGAAAMPSPMPVPEDDSAPPEVVGPAPSAWGRKAGPPKSGGKASAPDTVSFDPDNGLDTARKAAARVRDRMQRGGGALGKAIEGLRSEDIVVVRGSFDHMETVLEALRVPYVLTTPFEAAQEDTWSRHKIVFWNCGEMMVPPRLLPRLYAGLREFVRGGGYLFTTDWGVSKLVEPCFPGYLKSSGRLRTIPEMHIEVRPAAGAESHPFLESVFEPETPRMSWWLEDESFDVQVADKTKVEVLLESPALARLPGSKSGVVAATFVYGRGRVLHLLGHYFQQKGTVGGAAGAQFLALNFVRTRLERDGAAAVR